MKEMETPTNVSPEQVMNMPELYGNLVSLWDKRKSFQKETDPLKASLEDFESFPILKSSFDTVNPQRDVLTPLIHHSSQNYVSEHDRKASENTPILVNIRFPGPHPFEHEKPPVIVSVPESNMFMVVKEDKALAIYDGLSQEAKPRDVEVLQQMVTAIQALPEETLASYVDNRPSNIVLFQKKRRPKQK